MRKNLLLLLLMSLMFSLNNCSDEFNPFNNEIDLLSKYTEIAIVNSNICVHDTIHYIRVQRGFSAEDFTEYAHNFDSLYYDPNDIEVNFYILKVHLIEDDEIIEADTLKKIVCRDTMISVDNQGEIGGDNVMLYYFKSTGLANFGFNETFFGLEVINGDKKYYAHTKIIDAVKFALSGNANTFPIEYNNFDLSMVLPKYTARYIVNMNCRYYEIKLFEDDLDTVIHTVDILIADKTRKYPLTSSDSAKFTHTTEFFYNNMEKHILQNGDFEHTYFRRLKDVYFSSIICNYDLLIANNEIQLDLTGFDNSPMYFSNIKNGLGYFSAYGTSKTRIYYYTSRTIDQFIDSVGYKYDFWK